MHEASSAKLAKVAELTDKLTELVKAKANEVRDRDTPFGLAVWLVGPAMYFFMEPGHAEVLCDDGVKHRLREEVLSQIPGDVRKTLLDRFLLTPKDSGWVFAPGAARGHRKPKKDGGRRRYGKFCSGR
jgi:hypothetical protein